MRLNGETGVRSTLGIGSTFFVELPLHMKEKRKVDVLFVDDEDEHLNTLEMILIHEDLVIEFAQNTNFAQSVLEKCEVKCVVSDLVMPGEDGIKFLKNLGKTNSKIKRVLMTGKGDPEALTDATNEAKVDKILLKPLHIEKMVQTIKSLVDEYDLATSEKIIDILYVDDEPDLCESFEKEFSNDYSTFTIYTALNASGAKRILNKHKVKCVVSDLNMPSEDGVDLLTYVRKNFPETQRLLITGHETSNIPKDALTQAKIQEIFDKPIQQECIHKIASYAKDAALSLGRKVNLENYKPKEWHLNELEENNDVTIDEVSSTGSELIMVVDDIKDMREILSKMLKKQNFGVITAKDGFDALEKVKKYNPDLIITDWMMPNMSGLDFIDKLNSDESLPEIPTILLTAKSDEDSKLVGTAGGASAYIGKPFNKLELFSTVKNLLKLKKGEEKINKLNTELSENVLKRFLPPSLVDGIVAGEGSFDREYEKINVTILFTDICSFSQLSGEIGPQRISKMLNTYLEEMTNVIFDHGGTIDKIMGDSIMAMWGAPEEMNHEDQIKNAYNCSIALNEKLLEINEIWKKDSLPLLTQRIGIHQGPAVVGYFGGRRRSDYTAIGGTINKAQRI
jgi:DNA-binding NtrC family response regulator